MSCRASHTQILELELEFGKLKGQFKLGQRTPEMAKDKDSVKERILCFEQSIMNESKVEDQASSSSQAIPAYETLTMSFIEKIFEVMMSAVQSSMVMLKKDMAKKAARRDAKLN
ncbi:hypothetical protein ACH5RR_026125 [Cinchona calisaya]|uniref:Uncharacterized protein n=1 Tax=Cinchona calisaya TaxID=153742 RepID=A0ABD2Z6M6_9GENT